MISAGIYTFLSVLGMLWGIVSSYPKTAFGKILYNSTLFMGSTYFIIAIAAAISSLILRKKQKNKSKHLDKCYFVNIHRSSIGYKFPCRKNIINIIKKENCFFP